MLVLESPLRDAIGGTAKTVEKAFGLGTVDDLLRHYPRRLVERGELTDLADLALGEEVTVAAEVVSSKVRLARGKKRLEVVITDGRGRLQLVFFGKTVHWQERRMAVGVRGLFAGTVGEFNGRRQLVHPESLLLSGGGEGDLGAEADQFAGALIPIYPATKALRSWTIARCVRQTLGALEPVPDPLPAEMRARHGLMDLDSALRAVHLPDSWEQWFAARRRLTWDEAMTIQVVLAQRRQAAADDPATARPGAVDGLAAAFDASLPFSLTAGQAAIGDVIGTELGREHPMHRLLQGEVGSGKTVVALRAMLQVVDSGGQAALLAPTEVLATQHARTIESMLGPLARGGQLGAADGATRVALLTGSLPAARRKEALLDAVSGAAGIVIGTHALIQDQVSFADLGLVVVDEQHRFGVEQRDALRSKADKPPHLLVMTATPIPRTVAMTVFGDLETSVLDELPAGRAPIATSVVPAVDKPQWLERAWARIGEEVAAGRQAFVVCPRIGDGDAESDLPDPDDRPEDVDRSADAGAPRRPAASVLEVADLLRGGPLAGLRLEVLHGRMNSEDKDRVMTAFTRGEIDVLVSTTVIEVGVDVPNATVMAVVDADRFGVSQLHQLRGRVGRGSAPGLCLLVSDAPEGTPARERLDAVAATTDGFELARVDVEQRREGDVLGVAQSGRRSQLRLLSLLRDEPIIVAARGEATDLVAADPTLAARPLLAAQVARLADDERGAYLEKS